MTNFEMVEKLREKANVSYEQAKEALEKSNWDILDAMILLEREGNVSGAASATYSTNGGAGESAESKKSTRPGFGEVLTRILKWIGSVLKIGNENEIVIEKGDEHLAAVPVTIFVLLLIVGFWIIVPLLILGLFFGYKYSVRGPQLGKESVNDAINKASKVVEDIKEEFKGEKDKKDEE